MIIAIIGANYGDEGKGLVTDYFASQSSSCLVVRHNGGAQSGHTVEIGNKRFVFHELSSGSFRHADTYWSDTFTPDLYKLGTEIEAFSGIVGFVPKIFCSRKAAITTIDDVLLNMLLETSRGDKRHGSCGMGINEADLRNKAGFSITVGDVASGTDADFYRRLSVIREAYTATRLDAYGLSDLRNCEYFDLLQDDSVLRNYAETVMCNLAYVTIADEEDSLLSNYADLIFETGQGLRLDAENRSEWPHVTASRTGLSNILDILARNGRTLDQAVYVTRTYLTRHGAGPFDGESEELSSRFSDKTNTENPWQGSIRYARFRESETLRKPIREDLAQCPYPVSSTLFVTHLNETDDCMLFSDGDRKICEFLCEDLTRSLFERAMLSRSKESSLCKEVTL